MKTLTIDTFKHELKEFMSKYIAYESIDIAKKMCLDSNRPLVVVCSKYIANRVMCAVYRMFELIANGQSDHFRVRIGYEVNPNGNLTIVTMTI